MYASSSNSSTSSSAAIRVLRRSPNFSPSSSSSSLTTPHSFFFDARIASISSACVLLLLQLVEDLLDLHLGDLVELRVEDRVGLLSSSLNALHQLLGRVRLAAALADDLDRLVEGVEDDLEAFEDVNAPPQLLAARYSNRRRTVARRKSRKCRRISLRLSPSFGTIVVPSASGTRHGHVVREVLLQLRVLVEVRHHQVRVGARLHLQDDAAGLPSRSTRSIRPSSCGSFRSSMMLADRRLRARPCRRRRGST